LIETLSALPADQVDLPVVIDLEGDYVDVTDVSFGQAAILGQPDIRFLQLYNSKGGH
jgi:hypothetical protein